MKNVAGDNKNLVQKVLLFLSNIGFDGFILALLAMIVLASIYPQGGIGEGPYSLSSLASYGVSAVFFFYGLRLSGKKLKAGLSNWKLHLLVQSSTFVLFPLLLLLFKPLFINSSAHVLWLGAFFLASLPSTVSSSVVMVSIAEGNIPAAIFNASISSIIGVFITPLWMQLAITTSGESTDLKSIFVKLILQVLLPVIIGLALHVKWGTFAEKYKKQLKYFDQLIILIIVYTAFCDSFARHMFSNVGMVEIGLLALCMLALFFFMYWLLTALCNLLGFNREDRITTVFCGSKKSLVHGTVMSKVLFANSTIAGILLLPLMLYHALQLIMASMLAQRLARHKNRVEKMDDPGGAVTI